MNQTDSSAYVREGREFSFEVPEYFNFARDTLAKWAGVPNKRALLWVDERGDKVDLTFEQIADRTARLAAAFQDLGLRKGDRALVILPPIPAWWETFMALLQIGVVVVPGTSQLTARDIRYRVESAEATALIADESIAAKADEVLESKDLRRIVV